MKKIFRQKVSSFFFATSAVLVAALFVGAVQVFATPYLPGATLTPGCAPTTTDCTVAIAPAAVNFVSKTANYTVASTDQVIYADTSGGSFTITLPTLGATVDVSRKIYIVKTSGSNTLYINAASGETINQLPSLSLVQNGRAVTIESVAGTGVTSTNWIGTFNMTELGVSPLSVRVATTAVLSNSPTYSNGASGVGATLTAGSVGVLTVDGVALVAGNRVLVKDQASALQNGVYSVTTEGTAGVAFILTRTTDSDASGEFDPQIVIPTEGTTTNKGKQFGQQTSAPTIGTDSITYAELGLGITQETSGSQVAGRIPFYTGTLRELSKGTNKLVWDSTNNRLGVGDATPQAAVTVRGDTLGNPSFVVETGQAISAGVTPVDGNRIALNGGKGSDATASINGGQGGQTSMVGGAGGDSALGTTEGGKGGWFNMRGGRGGTSTGGLGGRGGGVYIYGGKGGFGATQGEGAGVRIVSGDPAIDENNAAYNPDLLSCSPTCLDPISNGLNGGNVVFNPYQETDSDTGIVTPHARDKNVGIGNDAQPIAKLDVYDNRIQGGVAIPEVIDSMGVRVRNLSTDVTAAPCVSAPPCIKMGVKVESTGSFPNGENYGIYIKDVSGGSVDEGLKISNGGTMDKVIDITGITYLDNAGVWQPGSSHAIKENYESLDKQTILQKIMTLPVERWNYIIQHDQNVKHIGPYAEDFTAAFGTGPDNVHLSPGDSAGVALIGIQALNEKFETFTSNFGASLANLAVSVQSLVAQVITAGKVSTDKLEMTDTATGQTYCVTLANGDFAKVPGQCQ